MLNQDYTAKLLNLEDVIITNVVALIEQMKKEIAAEKSKLCESGKQGPDVIEVNGAIIRAACENAFLYFR